MQESNVMKSIMLCASKVGARLFRNNVGVLQDKFGNYVRYGLAQGSSDLIGWTQIEITPEMVGKKVAVFTAIETKKSNFKIKNTPEHQINFIEVVKKSGGIAGVACSDDDYKNILNKGLTS